MKPSDGSMRPSSAPAGMLTKMRRALPWEKGRTLSIPEEKQRTFVMGDRPVRFLLLPIWFGLLTGFGEVCLLLIKKFVLGQFIRYGPNVVWMAPLADAFLFLVPGLVLLFLAWRWPKFVSLQAVIFVFAFLGFLSLLFMYYPLHVYAKALLAAGLAVQTARLMARRAQKLLWFAGQSVGWMAVVVVGLALGVNGWQWIGERRALAQLPPASTGAPNVLLIVLDTVRAKSLGLYGYDRPTTPNLQRLAHTGARFERAISPSPWTLPSHASMFTGRWPDELSANWESPLDATYSTLAEVLRSHGYVTAGFVANTQYCGYEFGLNRGFVRYEDYVVSPAEILVSSSLGRAVANSGTVRRIFGYYDGLTRKNAAAVSDHFLSWLARTHYRPFFAFLNYFDAHEPYLPPAPFGAKFGAPMARRNDLITQDLRRGLRRDWPTRPPQEIEAERDAYDGAIAYLDHHLGRLFDELRKRGVLENTLIILTSDHGEQFGEHGLFLHGNSLYQPLLHVPLVISFPARVPAGTSVPAPVSLRDLPATVVDLTGLKGENPFPGGSLAQYWAGRRASANSNGDMPGAQVRRADWGEEWYPTVKGDMQALTSGTYHYIKNGDGREELYNIERDSQERHDLARSEEGRGVLDQFRTALKAILTRERMSN